ncbi:hypothetical protein AgCh_005641 [Apium graveolens]
MFICFGRLWGFYVNTGTLLHEEVHFKGQLSNNLNLKSFLVYNIAEWTLYEQVAVAAMDCQCIDVAKDCIKVLQKKFPNSKIVGTLEAMLLEAKGSWKQAEKAYSSFLEDNSLDQFILKRRVAMTRAQGNTSGAIEKLDQYLEIFMADHDAWRELAEIYVSLQMYKQATFCYEELLLSQPMIPIHHLAYADVSGSFMRN